MRTSYQQEVCQQAKRFPQFNWRTRTCSARAAEQVEPGANRRQAMVGNLGINLQRSNHLSTIFLYQATKDGRGRGVHAEGTEQQRGGSQIHRVRPGLRKTGIERMLLCSLAVMA